MIESTTEPIDVTIKPAETKISYKTKLTFIDNQRGKKEIVSVTPPSISDSGLLGFLLEDRLINYQLSEVFSFETEQLRDIEPSKIILSEKI